MGEASEPRFPDVGRGPGLPVDTTALGAAIDGFTSTVVGDFSVDDILRQLLQAATKVLQTDGAGVIVPGPNGGLTRIAFATSGAAEELERLQELLQEGPCRESHRSGRCVNLADLSHEGAWPAYQRRAVELGVRAVAAIPLRARERGWGVLDVYRAEPIPLGDDELGAVRTLANLATSYLVVADDRDRARRAQAELADRAMHDMLTGLPNRWVFLEQLAHALHRLRRRPGKVAVLFLDLDGLKYVNDTYGHFEGDRLITAFVEHVRSTLRPVDMMARIGGDEFVVLLEDIAHSEEATTVARRVVGAVSVPHQINGDAVPMSASVGIAVTDDPLRAAATLIAHADAAMYQAKRSGRGRITVFDPAEYARQRAGVAEEVRLAEELRRALTGGELEVHYQPIVDLADPRLFATEALLRWRHPSRGLVTAGAFIDTAERAGLLPLVGAWVLSTACRQAVEWEQTFGERSPRYLFMNLAPVELTEPLLIERTERTLATSGLPPERLVLEITESGLFQNATAAVHTAESLRSLGCGLAIDDFGTGYSSLSRLADIPAGTIKIDQTFSRHLPTNPGGTAVVSAVQALGNSLGRTVIAEGVETEDSLDELRRIGIRHVQGFLLARPMPADELSARLAADGFGRR